MAPRDDKLDTKADKAAAMNLYEGDLDTRCERHWASSTSFRLLTVRVCTRSGRAKQMYVSGRTGAHTPHELRAGKSPEVGGIEATAPRVATRVLVQFVPVVEKEVAIGRHGARPTARGNGRFAVRRVNVPFHRVPSGVDQAGHIEVRVAEVVEALVEAAGGFAEVAGVGVVVGVGVAQDGGVDVAEGPDVLVLGRQVFRGGALCLRLSGLEDLPRAVVEVMDVAVDAGGVVRGVGVEVLLDPSVRRIHTCPP